MITFIRRYFFKSSFQKKLFAILGFYPKNTAVYKTALTHKSINRGKSTDNERLEFLGDAILGAVVADVLFDHFKNKKEGFLTQMRSKVVSRKMLNKLAFKIGLDKLVRKHAGETSHSIYGNALEAFVAAIYIDKGYNHSVFFIKEKLIKPHLPLEGLVGEVASYKSKCLEWGQQNKKQTKFVIAKEEGKDHNKKYTVDFFVENKKVSTASGTSIKRAEESAARIAFKDLTFS